MPRAEKGTPKDIANRMKAKGLQKLKWYCQLCNKQCRDDNGFKCHLTSESHLRQMKLFGQKSNSIIDQYSREFEKVFLDTLRRRHGTLKLNANSVYQEVIQDKNHVHMNATRWSTLSGFVQYLGKTGKCIVEESERGWNIQYIERDPFLLARQEKAKRRAEAERIEEMKQMERIELQRIEAAKALDKAGGVVYSEASNMDSSKKNSVALSLSNKTKKVKTGNSSSTFCFESDNDDKVEIKAKQDSQLEDLSKKRYREVDIHINKSKDVVNKDKKELTLMKKIKTNTDEKSNHWLDTGIIVRILSKTLGNGEYYKRKGIIDKVIDKFTAQIEVLDSSSSQQDGGDILQVDQDDLETVIPSKTGKKVKILMGEWRGYLALVDRLNDKKNQADLSLLGNKKIVEGISYDHFSKAE